MNKKKVFTWICLFLACFWGTQVFAKTPSLLEIQARRNSTIVAQTNDDDVKLFEENSALSRAQTLNQQGLHQLANGQIEAALETWQAAEIAYDQAGDTLGVFGSQINQAQAMQGLGLYRRSLTTLTTVKEALQNEPNSLLKADTLRSLGKTLQRIGDIEQARQVLEDSLEITRELGDPQQISDSLIALGNLARIQEEPNSAYDYYQDALEIGQCPNNQTCASQMTRIQAQINQLSLLVEHQEWEYASELPPVIKSELAQVAPSRLEIYARINFADSLIQLQSNNPESLREAAQQLATAINHAKKLGDQRAESYGLGKLGHLYEETQQVSEATKITEQALLIAQSINAADIAYRWQWQLGRLLKAKGQKLEAIAIYTQAVDTLQSLRSDLVAINSDVQFSFRESVEPVYRELVSELLANQATQADLKQALNVLEFLQLAELDNFFQDACLDTQPVQINQIDQTAAVLYPIILADRLEVILSLPGQPLIHYSREISQGEVDRNLAELRKSLSPVVSKKTRLELSAKIYDWLIRPIEEKLAESGVKTLVFVPDGAFRNVPMSTLYDGEKYLIEKYAIALTPGLQLLEPRSLKDINLQALTAGLTESRQGFSPLPAVEFELNQIQSQVPGKVLLNDNFTRSKIQAQLEGANFPVVHLATHGQFSSKAEDTFILTWDGTINVKELNEFLSSTQNSGKGSQSNRTPIELLVFSACETAAGDNRAALGLAGMAVRSGARSTLATLWAVKDAATALFMVEFYRILSRQPGITKAEALRQAQITFLENRQYQHPFYWAPFVLVGNWL
jgi:CHAT domain-containing protein